MARRGARGSAGGEKARAAAAAGLAEAPAQPQPQAEKPVSRSSVAFAKLVAEMRLSNTAAAALHDYMDIVVSEKVDDMWQKGKQRLTQLQRDLAACRAENEELRAAVAGCAWRRGAADGHAGDAQTNSSTASGTRSPPQDESDTGSPEPERRALGEGQPGFVPQVPEMPTFLQLGPALPSLPFVFPGVVPPGFAPVPRPQEQRLLSLADALADSLPADRATFDATTRPAPPPGMEEELEAFSLTLRKQGSELGLNVMHGDQERYLTVQGITPGCAAEAWNLACGATGERKIELGDRIVAINGIEGEPEAMLQECKEKETLVLSVTRPRPAGATEPGRPAALGGALRADASVFVPMSSTLATTSPTAADSNKASR